MSERATIFLSSVAYAGMLTVKRFAGVDADNLGFDLREAGFRAAQAGEPTGITLDVDGEETDAAILMLRGFGYAVVVDGA